MDAREIRAHRFSTARQGYKPEEVQDYLGSVADVFEKSRQELEQLRAMSAQLAEELKQYVEQRDSITRALSKAEIMADEILRDANEEARKIKLQTEQNAQELIAAANAKADVKLREATATAEQRLRDAKDLATQAEETAKERSAVLIRGAEQKAYAALHNLEDQRANIRREADELSALSARFKLDMINAYEHQLRVLRQLPDDIAPAPASATEPEEASAVSPTPIAVQTEPAVSEEAQAVSSAAQSSATADATRFSGYFTE
ncbi:MAG: DivIVA domain-containing protein [Oscillospiraceae bacterium]|jgi:DivIVA domain-containing protein|nr:DivIVA domain-containing protein [Oscillospiraceae bacterium]